MSVVVEQWCGNREAWKSQEERKEVGSRCALGACCLNVDSQLSLFEFGEDNGPRVRQGERSSSKSSRSSLLRLSRVLVYLRAAHLLSVVVRVRVLPYYARSCRLPKIGRHVSSFARFSFQSFKSLSYIKTYEALLINLAKFIHARLKKWRKSIVSRLKDWVWG